VSNAAPTSSAAAAFGNDLSSPSTAVRDLGFYLGSDLAMQSQIQKPVARCFAVLRQL
jgi:hypothetical protein